MNAIARAIPVIFLGLLLAGCASVKSTADFYFPYTTKTYPPRAKDAPIPILGQPPHEPYTAIGKLAFSTYENFAFLRKSMEYNARRVGADAVILKQYSDQKRNVSYYSPGYFNYLPVVNYYTTGKHGNQRTVAYVNTIPIYQPGYWVNDQQVLTTIDAEMILFKNPKR